ncbi:hypothetical protein JXQ70_06725 [bacterium]|nr:hypothetical protein [bacterium]
MLYLNRILITVLIMVILGQLVFIFSEQRLVVDDAYVSLRYAVHLSQGHGLRYNQDESPVEGYTNFLWVIVLALLYFMGLPHELTALALSFLFSLGCVFLTWYCARTVFRLTGLYLWGSILLLVSNISFQFWSASGMETGFYCFFVLLALIGYDRAVRGQGAFLLAWTLFGAALTRPEGLGIFLFSWLFLFCHKSGWRRVRRFWSDYRAFILVAAIYAGYTIFRVLYFGDFFPNTYYAKSADIAVQCHRGLVYFEYFLVNSAGFIFLLALCGRKALATKQTWFYTLGLIIWITATTICVGGDALYFSRFFLPMLPLLYLLHTLGLKRILEKLDKIRYSLRAPLSSLVITGYFLAAAGLTWHPQTLLQSIQETNSFVLSSIDIGRWVRTVVQPDDWIACYPAGALPYYAQCKVIDLYGLTDQAIAHDRDQDRGDFMIGHQKMNLQYILDRKPRLFLPQISLLKYQQFKSNPSHDKYGLTNPFSLKSSQSKSKKGHILSVKKLEQNPAFSSLYSLKRIRISDSPFAYFVLTQSE